MNRQRSKPRARPVSRRPAEPLRRTNTVRVSDDVARRVREGHPWIFQDALRGRVLSDAPGTELDVIDEGGGFVARALHDPHGNIVLRVFSRRPQRKLDRAHIIDVVREAARRRRHVLDLGHQACCRALSGDCEGLPSINVDRYAEFLVISAYSPLIDTMSTDLIASLVAAWSPAGIYLQRRFQPTGAGKALPGADLVYGRAAADQTVVAEERVRFLVDVTAPLGTGLFADMRLGRQAVARLAGGRKVLNCFSYTGGFSLMAALHGAQRVVSIDSAARAHARARANFSLNQLQPESDRYEFITGETLGTLERLRGKRQQFDLIVLDPPSFSQAKGGSFTTLKDYSDLLDAALQILAPEGIVCAASNTAKLSEVDFARAIGRASSHAGRSLLTIKHIHQPPDFPSVAAFPESNYLKFLVLQAN